MKITVTAFRKQSILMNDIVEVLVASVVCLKSLVRLVESI